MYEYCEVSWLFRGAAAQTRPNMTHFEVLKSHTDSKPPGRTPLKELSVRRRQHKKKISIALREI